MDPKTSPLEILEEIFVQKSTRAHKGGEGNGTQNSNTTLLALVLVTESTAAQTPA